MSESAYPAADDEKPDVDLGDSHLLRWTEYEGERVGGIIRHSKVDSPNGYCDGAFWLRGNKFNQENKRNAPEWDFDGNWTAPTLSPSFLCHCGDHGFVRSGKWIKA